MSRTISVIGLGKLGACMAAVYASKGFEVFGVDSNSAVVDCLNRSQAPVHEKHLQDYVSDNRPRLHATTDIAEAVRNSGITFVIVPTPTDQSGVFSAEFVVSACEEIGRSLQDKQEYHLVVVSSTLMPGDCQEKIIPVLEKFSNKKCNRDFGFCYGPEFIAIGTVIHDLLHPDFFLIGESDIRAGDVLQDFYSRINSNSPVKRMNIPTAELTKISLNLFLTLKITYANMLSEVAEQIPGVDVDVVADAVGSDRRIGQKYLKGGLGFGGPCFPRDTLAFATMAQQHGVDASLIFAMDEFNRGMIYWVTGIIQAEAGVKKNVGIIGLSYKPGTYLCEDSQAITIAQRLVKDGYTVRVFESEGYEHAERLLGDSVIYCEGLADCVAFSDVLFLSNITTDARKIPDLIQKATTLIDPWRQIDESSLPEYVRYRPLGVGR